MKNVRSRGFTLIEMMIALVVLSVLIMLAAPAFRELIQNNRLLSEVYGLRAALNSARSEALAQRTNVTFCPFDPADVEACGSNWNEGYIAFTNNLDPSWEVNDPNDPDGDQIFVAKLIGTDSTDIAYSNSNNRVQFDSRGYARGFSGTFTVCDYRGDSDARGVFITAGGLVKALDPNDPVTCPP